MSELEYNRVMDKLRKRLELFLAAQRGQAEVKRYYRRGYKVRAHSVRGHYYFVVRRPKSSAAVKGSGGRRAAA